MKTPDSPALSVRENLKELIGSAIHGDSDATRALLDVAVTATQGIHRLWQNANDPGLSRTNPFNNAPMLNHYARGKWEIIEALESSVEPLFPTLTEVPTFPGWNKRKRKQKPRAQSPKAAAIEAQDVILKEISKWGTAKGRGRNGYSRHLLLTVLIPHAENVRCGRVSGPRDLRSLPPLDRDTCSAWAKALAQRVWDKKRDEVRLEGSDWHGLACGGRKKLGLKEKARDRALERAVAWLTQNGEPDKIPARTDQLNADWKKKLSDQSIVDRALKDGLYQSLLRGLQSLFSHPGNP